MLQMTNVQNLFKSGSATLPSITDSNGTTGFYWPGGTVVAVADNANSELIRWTGGTNTASMQMKAMTQANLGAPPNGTFAYCSDCTIANPCAGGGTGALAKRLNGVWVCN